MQELEKQTWQIIRVEKSMNKAKWKKLFSVISALILICTFCLAVAAEVRLVLDMPQNADGIELLVIWFGMVMLGVSWAAVTAVELCVYFALKYFLFETQKTRKRTACFAALLGSALAALIGVGWHLGRFFGRW